jgi:disulfide bond formation protein DsbB
MKNIIEFIAGTFKDKQQNPSGRELTIFVFVLMVIGSWIGEQFFGKHIPQWMFVAFISLIAAGIGLYTFEKPKENE